MKIQELYINNFKSLVDFKLVNPNPFSVFVGPNGAGKSNIFEALEYVNCNFKFGWGTTNLMFGGISEYQNYNVSKEEFGEKNIKFEIKFDGFDKRELLNLNYNYSADRLVSLNGEVNINSIPLIASLNENNVDYYTALNQFYNQFYRIFIGLGKKRLNVDSELGISPNADNLAKVLKRVISNEEKKEEILDWLRLFVPEVTNFKVSTDQINGEDILLIYEKNLPRPIRKHLISDGTYNILALLTAIYQSDEPQFLCIEEPENGLNPYVIKELVYLCRESCKQLGHTIWLNTHSQTLVSELGPEEIILVNKKEGITKAKQFDKDEKLFGLTMDEAWLSNALGGGLPW